MVERQCLLTAAQVRELSERSPRLVGYPMSYLDNGVESETLVVLLHGMGSDARRLEPFLRISPWRAIAPTLVGFEPERASRPLMGLDDHNRLFRTLLRKVVSECRPRTTVLMGYSAGADQLLRLMDSEEGAGVPLAGLVALGPNVSLGTCFVSKLFATLDPNDPEGLLESLKALGKDARPLSAWLILQSYVVEIFLKLGAELEPLRRYAADVLAPFERPGDPLASWYRAARERIPDVRLVFSNEEADDAEALLARHLEKNVLGDGFREDAFVIEPVHHMGLLDPGLILGHVERVVEKAVTPPRPAHDR